MITTLFAPVSMLVMTSLWMPSFNSEEAEPSSGPKKVYQCAGENASPSDWSSDSAFMVANAYYAFCVVDTRKQTMIHRENESFIRWQPNQHRFLALRDIFNRKHLTYVLVDAVSGRDLAVRTETHADYSKVLDYSSDGELFLRIANKGKIEIWDPLTLQPLPGFSVPRERCSNNVQASFRPGSHQLLTAHACVDADKKHYRRLRLIDPKTGTVLHTQDQHRVGDNPYGIVWSADGSQFISRVSDHVFEVFTAQLESVMKIKYQDKDLDFLQAEWNPDGDLLALKDHQGVRVFDLVARKKIASLSKNMAYAPLFGWVDSQHVIAHSPSQDTLFAYNVRDQAHRMIATFNPCDNSIPDTLCISAFVSPDKKYVAVTDYDKSTRLRVMRLSDGEVVLEDNKDEISFVNIYWSPDSQNLSYEGYRQFTVAPIR